MYQTRRASGNWTTVSRRSDYASVVSNYAAAIKAAQENANNIELQNKVLNYKNGLLSYNDLKAYLTEKLAAATKGSQKELDFRELMFDLEEYDNKKKKDIERALLESKFAKNGISAEERLTIEQEMLKYSKEGTPDYTEQLAVIAEAGELKRVESNNSKISKLQSKLSEGGLSTDEQIEIMEETLSLTEKGTAEYAEVATKLGDLKEQRKQEQREAKMNEEVSALLDQYAEGGLDNTELLEINRVMQKYYEPGTEEYIDLKEKEADILGEMSKASGSAQSEEEEANVEKLTVDFERLQAEEANLQEKLQNGEITLKEYLEKLDQIYVQQQDIIDLTGGEGAGSEEQGKLEAKIEDFKQRKQLIDSGDYVALRVPGKNEPELVPISELEQRAEIIDDVGTLDEEGNFVSSGEGAKRVVTVEVDGEIKSFLITQDKDGKTVFELVDKRDDLLTQGPEGDVLGAKTVGVRTGLTFEQPGKPIQEPFAGLSGVRQQPDLTSLGTGEEAIDLSSPGLTVSSGVKSSSGSGKKSGGKKKKSSGGGSSFNFTPVQTTTSKVKTALKAKGQQIIKSARPEERGSTKFGKKTKGAFGTPDYGITEKLGIGKKIKKAKSWYQTQKEKLRRKKK